MLLRLALSNIKNHLRDYVVLLTGLVMSSAIFYMFANLATNEGFIKANATFKYASPVFIFGEVLLVIITFEDYVLTIIFVCLILILNLLPCPVAVLPF